MNRDDFVSVNGADYIRAMFRDTRDGVLTFVSEEDSTETWHLDWDEETAEEIVQRFEKLMEALTRIGREHAYWERSTRDMPEDLLDVWNTYIAEFPDHGIDMAVLQSAWTKEYEDVLTAEEEEALRQHREWFIKHAEERMPPNRCTSATLISRARRYERLMALHAPKILLEHEARLIGEEMVLYYCKAD